MKRLIDIATIERAIKNKKYPEGSLLIQLSASNGEVILLDSPQCVDSRYAVAVLQDGWNCKYIFYSLQNVMPEFIAKYQSGINLQQDTLKYIEICVHEDKEKQAEIVEMFEELEKEIEMEEKIILKYQDMKKEYLGKMLC